MQDSTRPPFSIWPLLVVVFLAIALWCASLLQAPPAPRTGNPADTTFSAQQALAHVEVIARQPHPAGSAANQEVRAYLVETLEGLGADVEVQRRLQPYEYTPRPGQARFAYVENVIARIPGRDAEQAVLVMAHYDSVPQGPGAGDNASGVATALEAVRALTASSAGLRNTVLVLFTDAEEVGVMGAQAFFGHHRWAEDVEVVLNVDSRGSRGPVFMYETSEGNGALIEAVAEAVPSPAANSLIYAVFQKMPNFTDLSIATAAGKAGMNFAFIDGYERYHNAIDTPDGLSLASLQHLGDYALPLIRHFGNAELPVPIVPNRHYFNPVGHVLVQYEAWLDWVVLAMAMVLIGIATGYAVHAKTCTALRVVQGAGTAVLLVAVPALVVLLLDMLLDHVATRPEILARQRMWFVAWAFVGAGLSVGMHSVMHTGLHWAQGVALTGALVGLALAAGVGWSLLVAAVVLGGLLTLLAKDPAGADASSLGALWVIAVIALAMLVMVPGGAHIVTWPLLAVACAQVWGYSRATRGALPPLVWLLAGLPGVVLLGTTALNFDLFIGYALPIVSVIPLLLLLMLHAPLLVDRSARITGLVVVLLGALGLGWLALTPAWQADEPQPVSLMLLHDADQRQTYWATTDRELSEWHRAIFGESARRGQSALYQPRSPGALWLAPTDAMPLDPPTILLVAADREAHRLRLRLQPSRAGDTVTLWISPATDLRAWHVNGQALQGGGGDYDGWRSITGFAVPAEGVEIILDVASEDAWPELLLVGERHALPEQALPLPILERLQRSYASATSAVAVRKVATKDLVEAVAPIAP